MARVQSLYSIRHYYETLGVQKYYEEYGNHYSNPHESKLFVVLSEVVRKYIPENSRVLDFACGDGLVTRYLCESKSIHVEGCDPYTKEQYMKTTNKPCLSYSFLDIATGQLDKTYDVVICCYAYHLIDKSLVHDFLYYLSTKCQRFIVVSQTKNIHLQSNYWKLMASHKRDKVYVFVMDSVAQELD